MTISMDMIDTENIEGMSLFYLPFCEEPRIEDFDFSRAIAFGKMAEKINAMVWNGEKIKPTQIAVRPRNLELNDGSWRTATDMLIERIL